jgi:hypothetical protein
MDEKENPRRQTGGEGEGQEDSQRPYHNVAGRSRGIRPFHPTFSDRT